MADQKTTAPPYWRGLVVCVALIAAVICGAALHWLQPVMIPFILAMLLTAALQPVVRAMVLRLKMPRIVAILTALAVGGVLIMWVGGIISGSVRDLAAHADVYEQQARRIGMRVVEWAAQYGFAPEGGLRAELESLPIGPLLAKSTSALISMLSNSFLVLLFTIYLLLGYDPRRPPATGIRATIEGRVRRYVALKIVLSGATGVCVALTLWALGVELAAVFGLLACLLNLVPTVGSIVATLLPLPIVVFTPGATDLTIILALAIPGLVQVIIGNVLEPKLLGESLDLHPITILLSLILWGMLWGIPGMVLATPLTAVIKILLAHLEPTRPLAALLAGRASDEASPEI